MKLIVAIWVISILTSCTSQKLVVTKPVKKEPAVYPSGVATLVGCAIILFSIKFKEQ